MQSRARGMIQLVLFVNLLFTLQLQTSNGGELECESLKATQHDLPQLNRLGNSYEITIRSTDLLRNRETAKFVEKNFNGTALLVKKWTRQGQTQWLNRTVLVEDHYYWEAKGRYIVHNRTCRAVNSSSQLLDSNSFSLSAEFLAAAHLDGSSFGQLLAAFTEYAGKWNATIHSNGDTTIGIETLGWTGCIANFSGSGKSLQLRMDYAGDKTPELPYSPAWENPLLYTLELTFYEVNATSNQSKLFDQISFDIVTLDSANPEEAETALSPPRGLFCEGMPAAKLPIQSFPDSFSVHFVEVYGQNGADRMDGSILYDANAKLGACSYWDADDRAKRGYFMHDFVSGLQYQLELDKRAICRPVKAIETVMDSDAGVFANGTIYMISAEEVLLWGGPNRTKGEFYRAGKTLTGGQLLEVFVSQYSVANSPNESFVLEVLLDQKGRLHSTAHYGNGQKRRELRFSELSEVANGWQVLSGPVRSCIGSPSADNETDFFVQLSNADLAKLQSVVGLEWVKAAVAGALTQFANISQMRIIDLILEEHSSIEPVQTSLFAFFSIGAPSGVKPAQTIYLKEEIAISEAARALNESIVNKKFVVKIPISDGNGPNKEMDLSGTEFGTRASLAPPCPTPPPGPSPRFVGFSGASLAIVAFFSFIFGVGLVVGSYVFYQKRQQIRGMAYQVFE